MLQPDKKRAPDVQDKRTVVPMKKEDWDTWLYVSMDQADALIKVPTRELFVHRAKIMRSMWILAKCRFNE